MNTTLHLVHVGSTLPNPARSVAQYLATTWDQVHTLDGIAQTLNISTRLTRESVERLLASGEWSREEVPDAAPGIYTYTPNLRKMLDTRTARLGYLEVMDTINPNEFEPDPWNDAAWEE